MFLDGGEVVVQVSYRVTLKPIESVCETDGKIERVLAVSSTAFVRMAVDARGPAGWTEDDGCGPIVQRSRRKMNRGSNSHWRDFDHVRGVTPASNSAWSENPNS